MKKTRTRRQPFKRLSPHKRGLLECQLARLNAEPQGDRVQLAYRIFCPPDMKRKIIEAALAHNVTVSDIVTAVFQEVMGTLDWDALVDLSISSQKNNNQEEK